MYFLDLVKTGYKVLKIDNLIGKLYRITRTHREDASTSMDKLKLSKF